MHELPDEYLADALPIAKKIAIAQGVENYNILQVRIAVSAVSPSAAADLLLPLSGFLLTRSVSATEQWAYRASGTIRDNFKLCSPIRFDALTP